MPPLVEGEFHTAVASFTLVINDTVRIATTTDQLEVMQNENGTKVSHTTAYARRFRSILSNGMRWKYSVSFDP